MAARVVERDGTVGGGDADIRTASIRWRLTGLDIGNAQIVLRRDGVELAHRLLHGGQPLAGDAA